MKSKGNVFHYEFYLKSEFKKKKKSASEVGAAVIIRKRPTVVDVKHTMTTQCWTIIYSVRVL